MKDLNFESNEYGPTVTQNGHLIRIAGRSIVEDAVSYFKPLYDWLTEYLKSNDKIEVEIDLSYFNSPTAKQILKILMAIDESEKDSEIRWIYPKENDILLDRGKELGIMLDMKIKFIPK